MKRLLNTLFITRQESYLHKERETIVVKLKSEKIGQFPIHNIGQIMCFGQISVSPFLMGFCAEKDVGLTFYTEYGRFLCRVVGRPVGNVLLRRKQYRWADDQSISAGLAKLITSAKIANSRAILQRQIRNHGDNEAIDTVVKKLATSIRRCKSAGAIDQIRGMEGESAANDFSIFDQLIKGDDFSFAGSIK